MEQTTLTSKGQVTIPKSIREQLGLHAGDKIEFAFNEKNEVVLKRITKKADEVFGILHAQGRKIASLDDMEAGIRQKIRDSFG